MIRAKFYHLNEAWLHFTQYRVRCRECDIDFCSQCKTTPYHKGFTCESFKEYKKALQCRFCKVQLEDHNTAEPGDFSEALRKVCTLAECIERRESACSLVHDCEHDCGGVKDEREHLPCLHEDCKSDEVTQDATDLCNICWVEELDK